MHFFLCPKNGLGVVLGGCTYQDQGKQVRVNSVLDSLAYRIRLVGLDPSLAWARKPFVGHKRQAGAIRTKSIVAFNKKKSKVYD